MLPGTDDTFHQNQSVYINLTYFPSIGLHPTCCALLPPSVCVCVYTNQSVAP